MKNILFNFLPRQGGWILFIATLIVLGLQSHSNTEGYKNMEEFRQYYRIYSLAIPKTVSFAGKQIPLTDYDVAERYDKEILTNVYWQSQTLLLLKRTGRYMPQIEKILKEENVPDDFKYLVLAESGLQQVVSPAGAAGFWQFLDKTGKRYGLEINECIDERYHLEKATRAAAQYLKESYAQLKNWELVAASYNMGLEGIKKQMRNQLSDDYFQLYLNTETSRYLFRIIALKDICENPSRYGFNIPASEYYKPQPVIYNEVKQSIPALAEYCVSLGCSYKEVKLLNPWLRDTYLNVPEGKVYYIALPKQKMLSSDKKNLIEADTLRLN